MKEALLYDKKTNNAVQCRLCRHNCRISEGEAGACGIRVNAKGVLHTHNYGCVASQGIDPVEKKPLYHFYPGALTYSIGALGCNFSCENCQNFAISQPVLDKALKTAEFHSPERIIEDAVGNDCPIIAYTYNEPTLSLEFYLEVMRLAHANGLKNIWVSNGYMSRDCLDLILPYLDAINIDLKAFDKRFYRNNCGAKLDPVLENLKSVKNEQVHLEISTLLIPSHNDDLDMLYELAQFIANDLDADTPWHILKFFPHISWKLKHLPPTGEDFIYQAHEIGKDAGLKYVYVGNVPGDQYENTYCPKCKEPVIRRIGQHIERLDNSGRCQECDRNLDIIE